MNRRLLLTALALAACMGLAGWSLVRMLQPAFVLDFLRSFTLC